MSKFQSFLSKPGFVVAVLFAAAAALFGVSLLEFIEVSGFTAAAVKLGLLAGFYLFVERILLRAFNTEEQIRTGNRSFAIVIGALVIGAGIILGAA